MANESLPPEGNRRPQWWANSVVVAALITGVATITAAIIAGVVVLVDRSADDMAISFPTDQPTSTVVNALPTAQISASPTAESTTPTVTVTPTLTPVPTVIPSSATPPSSTVTPVRTDTPSPTQIALPPTASSTPRATITPTPVCGQISHLIEPRGGGNIEQSPLKGCYSNGEQVEIWALPAEGFVFSGWSNDNLTSAPNPVILTLNGDKLIGAVFTREAILTLTPAAIITPKATEIPVVTPRPTQIPFTPPSNSPTPVRSNLVPFRPEGWESPLVMSRTESAFLNIPAPSAERFTVGEPEYAHWAIKNDSAEPVGEPFQVGLAVDGTLVMTFPILRLDANEVRWELNVELPLIETPGEHKIELLLDVDEEMQGVISESDETDNSFSIALVWLSPELPPTPTSSPLPEVSPTDTSTATPSATLIGKIVFESDRDGTQSNFDDNKEIHVINADGTGQKRLTNNTSRDATPSISPDGTTIVFTSERDGNEEIYTMNVDGSNPNRITSNNAVDLDFPDGLRQ